MEFGFGILKEYEVIRVEFRHTVQVIIFKEVFRNRSARVKMET